MRALALTSIAGLALAGCVLTPVDLTGRACPCADGWVCVAGVCEREEQRERDASTPADARVDAASPPSDAGLEDASDENVDVDAGHEETLDAAPPADAGAHDGGGHDAGGHDAGGHDAGGRDAGAPIDAGPDLTRCDERTDALFCDGFEWAYSAGRVGWTFESLVGTGTLTTTGTPAPYFGARVLRATTSAVEDRAALGYELPSGIVSGELWLRGYFFIPSASNVAGASLLYLSTQDRTTGVALQTRDGGNIGAWVGTAGGEELTSAVMIPRDRWTCLELQVVIADSGGEVSLYVDGVRAVRSPAFDTFPAGGYRAMQAGIEYTFMQSAAGTVLVDEVVLSRTRTTCD